MDRHSSWIVIWTFVIGATVIDRRGKTRLHFANSKFPYLWAIHRTALRMPDTKT